MAVADFLVDTSALARLRHSTVDSVLAPLLNAGRVAVCGMTTLEALFSARSVAEHTRLRSAFEQDYEWLHTEDGDFRRAIEVQSRLAVEGHLRAVPLPDLIIAAVSERHRVTLLHYDADYDLIAEVTGQAARWVVPRGSVD